MSCLFNPNPNYCGALFNFIYRCRWAFISHDSISAIYISNIFNSLWSHINIEWYTYAPIRSEVTVNGLSGGKEEKVLFRRLVDIPSTTYATFGLYRYPAKFIPHVIAYVLENYAEPCMKVFDPFAGYGTVGLVSRIYGYDYELWDLNPILDVLHSVATMELKQVKVDSILNDLMSSDKEFIPDWAKHDYWHPKEFLPFLYKVWGFYHSLNDSYAKLLLTIPLLKVTRYFSYDDMQRQKLSKSPKSIARIDSLKQKIGN